MFASSDDMAMAATANTLSLCTGPCHIRNRPNGDVAVPTRKGHSKHPECITRSLFYSALGVLVLVFHWTRRETMEYIHKNGPLVDKGFDAEQRKRMLQKYANKGLFHFPDSDRQRQVWVELLVCIVLCFASCLRDVCSSELFFLPSWLAQKEIQA